MTEDLWQRLEKTDRPIVLYGTGNGADKVMDVLASRDIPVSGIFASGGFVRDRYFRGYKVLSYEECREKFGDMTVLMCFGSSRPEVLENVGRIAAECEFYAPDVPVYGDELFDAAFYEKNKEKLEEVRRHLADGLSACCFDAHISYKLSGDIRYLASCETPREKIEDEFFHLPGGSFLDLGAYTGDTLTAFAGRNDAYRRLIAVEPDGRNFRKLTETAAKLRDTVCLNAAAGEADGELFFDFSKGRGAHAAASGSRVPCRSADSIAEEFGLDGKNLLIKADVEGQELAVINGAQRLIRKESPGLSIACYHRSEDLFTLPLRVLRLNPHYKIYMRHSPHIPAWDTEYYFIPEEET